MYVETRREQKLDKRGRVQEESAKVLESYPGLPGEERWEGARLSFLRRKVNGEVWLPAAVSYSGGVRVGLLRMLRRSGTSEFSDYRKFTVDTDAAYKPPRVP